MTTSEEEVYRVARRVLLDALTVLRPHHRAIVLVGAQAVYLRTEEIDLGVAPYTFDGDIVLDPYLLEEEPDLDTVMRSADFDLATDPAGNVRPGEWRVERELQGRPHLVPVDLLVPVGVTRSKRRSARLTGHTPTAARNVRGLEAALLDHSPMEIRSLQDDDPRTFRVNVAGAVSLLIAKAFKIHERVGRPGRPDRIDDKDAGDVYRLMQASDPERCAATARRLVRDPTLGEVCREGLVQLFDLFRASRTPGTALAIEHLRTSIPPERVAAVSTAFTDRLRQAVE